MLGSRRAYEDFTLEKYTADTTESRQALDYARGFNPKTDNAFIYGPAGGGKSHIAAAIARRFARFKVEKATDIMRELRAAVMRDPLSENDVIDGKAAIPIYVIDDMGVEKTTDFSSTGLYDIIDRRWLAKRNGLIVTSNLDLDALAAKLGDDRVASRLNGMCTCLSLTGERDRRIST